MKLTAITAIFLILTGCTTLDPVLQQFNIVSVPQEKEIGEDLANANSELRAQQKEDNKLNICPKCQKGNLGITYSKKTRRYFCSILRRY